MRRIRGTGMFCIALTMAVLTVPSAEAKKAAEPAPGPIHASPYRQESVHLLSGKRC